MTFKRQETEFEESKENNNEQMDYEPVIINIPEEIHEPEPITPPEIVPVIIHTTIFEPVNIDTMEEPDNINTEEL